jgi:hypothetical protein
MSSFLAVTDKILSERIRGATRRVVFVASFIKANPGPGNVLDKNG